MSDVTSQHDASTRAQREPNGYFAKGQSGNPSGRAKMPVEIREMLTAKAKDAVNVFVKYLTDTDARVALKAAELLLDRAYGKPQLSAETISFDLPDDTDNAEALVALHASLLRATARGEVAVSDAREMSNLFETHRRLVELSDLETRIAQLEQARENNA
jgi:hypothetical protein